MKPNFVNYLGRLAGAALIMAILAWVGPAWGQNYVINSDLDLNGQTITAKSVWISDNAKVKATSSIISASNIFEIRNSNVTATDNSTLSVSALSSLDDRGLFEIDGSNITLTHSKLTGDWFVIYDSQLTLSEGSEITADLAFFVGRGSQLTANGSTIDVGAGMYIQNSHLTALGTLRRSTIKADHIRLEGWGSDSQLTAEKSDIIADSIYLTPGTTLTLKEGSHLKTQGTQPYVNSKAGLEVYTHDPVYNTYYPYFGNSLVRIAGPGVTIENAHGAAFFNKSILDVGTYVLYVKGDLYFSDGSIYSLARTASTVGHTDVTSGQVTIDPGANLLITSGATVAANDQNKIIMNSADGFTTANVFKNPLFNLKFEDNNTNLIIDSYKGSQTVMEEAGAGANFINAGTLIDRILNSNPALGDKLLENLQKIYFALERDPAQAEKALRQLIGEGVLHTVNAHHNTVSQVAATLGGRLQTLIGGLPPAAGNGPADNRLWLKPFGQWNHQKDDNDVLGYHYNSGGLMLGYDREMALPGLTPGLYASLAQGRLENDLAETSLRTVGLGLYSLYEFGQYFVDASLGYSRSDNQANIGISEILGGGNKSSEFHSGSYQAGLDFGRVFQILEKTSLTPSAGIRLTQVKQKGWQEKVVSPDPENTLPANWFGDSQMNFVEIPLNLKLATTFETKGGATVSPELRLGGIIEANHPKSELRMGFVGSSDSTTISGIEPGRSRLVAGAGLKAQLSDTTDVFLNYDLEARSGYQGHSASAGIGISF